MQNLQSELFALLHSWEACGGRTHAAPTPVKEAEATESRHLVSREAAPDQGKRLTAESRSENVAPCPGVDSTRITPPWRRAIAWAIANPNPVPPC